MVVGVVVSYVDVLRNRMQRYCTMKSVGRRRDEYTSDDVRFCFISTISFLFCAFATPIWVITARSWTV